MSALLRTLAGMLVWFFLSLIVLGTVLVVLAINGIITPGHSDFFIINGVIICTIIGGYRGFRTPF